MNIFTAPAGNSKLKVESCRSFYFISWSLKMLLSIGETIYNKFVRTFAHAAANGNIFSFSSK